MLILLFSQCDPLRSRVLHVYQKEKCRRVRMDDMAISEWMICISCIWWYAYHLYDDIHIMYMMIYISSIWWYAYHLYDNVHIIYMNMPNVDVWEWMIWRNMHIIHSVVALSENESATTVEGVRCSASYCKLRWLRTWWRRIKQTMNLDHWIVWKYLRPKICSSELCIFSNSRI